MKNIDIVNKLLYQPDQVKIEESSRYHKYQASSLKIDYQAGASLALKIDHPYQAFVRQGKDQARDCFCFWIYQTKRQKGSLNFRFEKDSQLCCFFSFGLDFTGWRTAWLIYDRDMQGRPQVGMDKLAIDFPPESGSLYLTDIQLGAKIDPRHPTPDMQVPLVNPNIGPAGHWMRLLDFESDRTKKKETASPVSCQEDKLDLQAESRLIWQRQKEYLLKKYDDRLPEIQYDNLIQEWKKYDLISLGGGEISGVSIDSIYTLEILPPDQRRQVIGQGLSIDMRQTSELLLDMALLYQKSNHQNLANAYCQLSNHLIKQGLAYGSSLGTCHHYGYVLKSLFDSIFLMTDYLTAARPNLLQELVDMTIWMTGLGRIEDTSQEAAINIDVLNTYAQAMLMVILLEADLGYRRYLLEKFSNWLNASIEFAKGLEGTFKPDGSMYHHCNHYPAYGLDGLKSLCPLIYFLAGTSAQISSRAYMIVENAMEKLRWYCNIKHWPTALSARHPKTDGQHTHLTTDVFYYMALAQIKSGRPAKMAEIYLRLEGPLAHPDHQTIKLDSKQRIKELEGMGYEAESTPKGHLTMNWACAGFHRRGEWLAAIRGHNRYLWTHESYEANNLYGRYITYNHLQILSQGRPISLQSNGYQAEGFDWNGFAGTTVIELDFPQLRSRVYNLDEYSGYEEMLLTDEIFAGGLSLGENGMFAMKLHGHAKYDDSYRANLSTFFFGQTIIRLGSNIENTDQNHRTITTLFQSLSNEQGFCLNGQPIQADTYLLEDRSDLILVDGYRNGYWLPGHNQIEIKRGFQSSPAQDSGLEKSGHFTKALINHGPAPQNGQYEYVIGVDYLAGDFYDQVKEWQDKPFYQVLQKDHQAHIIDHYPSQTLAYALFEGGKSQVGGPVKSWQRPCLLMIKQDWDRVLLTFCDPDLGLYRGKDEGQYDSNGKHKECSVYSRDWIHARTMGQTTKIILDGLYDLIDQDQILVEAGDQTGLVDIDHNTGTMETSLEFWGIQAGQVEIILKRRR